MLAFVGPSSVGVGCSHVVFCSQDMQANKLRPLTEDRCADMYTPPATSHGAILGARMQCFSQSDRTNHRGNSSLFGERAFDILQHCEELRNTRNDQERHLQRIEKMEDLDNVKCLRFSSFILENMAT